MMIEQRPAKVGPAGAAELGAFLKDASERGDVLEIQGGNTLASMGQPVQAAHTVLSTQKLRRVLAYEFENLTVSVEAGLTLRALRALLAERNQFVPLDAPRAQHATVGGTLAAGWLGPRRHLLGRSRDYVIGSRVALADGTLVAAGGMVVKNVTGYDMSKLYIGSFGTLGVLVSANFKTLPLPAQARLFTARLPEHSWLRTLTHVGELEVPPTAALWVHGFSKSIAGDDGTDGRVMILLEGSAALIERGTRELRAALGRGGVPETAIHNEGARDLFERALDGYVAPTGQRSITYRIFGTPDNIESMVREVYGLAREHALAPEAIADILNGDIAFRLSAKDARAFAERIEAFDDALHASYARAQIIAGQSPVRPSLNLWGELPPAIEKMRALKVLFDPARILNPGRFIGGI
ncbi:MAG: hypothetical protein DLM50_02590 [Candidatus Meridianibacter frigidus]|nr:MAG: hypothetical protein DLM50_02590 [Candidatus Eremiobacteraeota bacterium]